MNFGPRLNTMPRCLSPECMIPSLPSARALSFRRLAFIVITSPAPRSQRANPASGPSSAGFLIFAGFGLGRRSILFDRRRSCFSCLRINRFCDRTWPDRLGSHVEHRRLRGHLRPYSCLFQYVPRQERSGRDMGLPVRFEFIMRCFIGIAGFAHFEDSFC